VRYLVYSLVFVNLVYFTWHQFSTPEKPQVMRPVPLAPGIKPLVLLAERQGSGSSAIAAAAKTGKQQQPIETAETKTEPEPVVEYVASDAADGLEPERMCQTIGPLVDKNDAATISAQLFRQGYLPAMRDAEVRMPSGYWVYMSAMPAGRARAIVDDLDANGMTDYFIGKRNHISLGLFSSKSKALARLNRIKTLGYDAELDQRYRARTVYWLDIKEKGPPLPGSAFWDSIQAQYADIRVQRMACE